MPNKLLPRFHGLQTSSPGGSVLIAVTMVPLLGTAAVLLAREDALRERASVFVPRLARPPRVGAAVGSGLKEAAPG